MKASHTPAPFEINLKIQWRRAGRISMRRNYSLKFPPVPHEEESGVYRILWEKPEGKRTVYIGEAENPRSRTTSYMRGPRKPRPSSPDLVAQRFPPNRKVSVSIRQAIRAGGWAEFQVAHVISVRLGNRDTDLKMDRLLQRKLIESAALVDAQVRGRAAIFNADAQP